MKKSLPLILSLCCIGANATSVNYDLLGRKSSKMNSPMVYKNVDYSKVKSNEEQNIGSSLENRALEKRASGTKGNVKAIVGKFGPRGYLFSNCSNSTTGCGEKAALNSGTSSLSSYLNSANQNFIKVNTDKTGLLESGYNYTVAGVTRSNLSGFGLTEYDYNNSVTYPVEASPHESNKTITYIPYSYLYNFAYRGYLINNNVGVYLSEEGLPTRLNEYMNPYAPFVLANNESIDSFNSMPGYEMRASRMYRTVEYASGRSVLFATKSRPSSPSTTKPQVYVGLHAYGGAPSKGYPTAAKVLDNYIYDNRTIEIVGAGNKANKGFASAGLAANAITVGAIDPFTNKATGYSARCAGCEEETFNKPEVMNYSHFYFDYPGMPEKYRKYTKGSTNYEYKPFYDGTEASAALTAGMVANMLSANEFYKWHPEVVKAVAINGQYTSRITKYTDLVFDQSDDHNTHHSVYFIGDVNTLMKEYNDCPRYSEIYCGKPRKEIRLHFSKSDLFKKADYDNSQNIDGFYASIAWLNSGTDISNLGGLPQNFEIEGYWRHGNPNLYTSLTSNAGLDDSSVRNNHQKGSPYKSVWVSGFQNDMHPLGFTIRIVLTDEDTRSENYGQMVLGLDIKPVFKF